MLYKLKKIVMIIVMTGLIFGTLILGNYMAGLLKQEHQDKVRENIRAEAVAKVDTAYLDLYEMDSFVSDLPVIMIDTHNQRIVKDEETWGVAGIMDHGENDIMAEEFEALLPCTVKLRGASSYTVFDKNQYRLKLYRKENGKSFDYELCGLPADSDWVLNGPFLDKTAVRNALVYNLAASMNLWAPKTAYAEVFENGKYQGLYVVTEPVEEGEFRLKLSDYALASGKTPYILKRDRDGTEINVIATWGYVNGMTSNELSISYPKDKSLTFREKQWIRDDVSEFEEVLYSPYFAQQKIGYEKYIDVDSFVDYYLLNEVVLNHDAGLLSTYVYRDLNQKMKMAVWDYNNAFDNYQWFSMETDRFHLTKDSPWFSRLLQDRNFVKKVCERYRELRKQNLNTEYMYAFIDQQEQRIDQAMERNNQIWGYTYQTSLLTDTGDEDRDLTSRQDAIVQLKTVIQKRFEFMDNHIEDLYTNCIN